MTTATRTTDAELARVISDTLSLNARLLRMGGAPCDFTNWTKGAIALRNHYKYDRLPPILCTLHSLRLMYGPSPYLRDARKPRDWPLRHRSGLAYLEAYARGDWDTLAEGLSRCFLLKEKGIIL